MLGLYNIVRFIAVILSLFLLASCVAIRDTADLTILKQNNKGIVVFVVDLANENCNNTGVQIARRDGLVFRRDRGRQVRHLGTFKPEIVNEFEAGEYHIVYFQCAFGKVFGGVPSDAKPSTVSFASFSVSPGEVINAGALILNYDAEGKTVANLTPMPQEALDMVQTNYPNLFKRLISRPMKIEIDQYREQEAAMIEEARTRREVYINIIPPIRPKR